ncbi:MAG: hypothetical protein K9J30_09020 [Bacteroidales bacterium]|nr:hypothetical protein [Bacteroidales bacterium]
MRDELVKNIKDIILGPMNGIQEKLHYRPLNLYTTGILYPQTTCEQLESTDVIEPEDNPEGSSTEDDSETKKNGENTTATPTEKGDDDYDQSDDELKLATSFSPSSMGFSFIVANEMKFSLRYAFGRYQKKKSEDNEFRWERNHVTDELICLVREKQLIIDEKPTKEIVVLNEEDFKARINIFVRAAGSDSKDCSLITISMINSLHVSVREQRKDQHCIFQPELSVSSEHKAFQYFPDKVNYSILKDDEEALNTALLFRDYHIYAMGHGISVNWSCNKTSSLFKNEIWTEVMPEETVFGVSFDVDDTGSILEMKRLSGPDFSRNSFTEDQLKNELHGFIKKYADWIKNQKETLSTLTIPGELKQQGDVNLKTCLDLFNRLEKGIELIFSDSRIKQAFFDANKAMFMQRVMGQFSSWRREHKNVLPGSENYEDCPLPDFQSLPSEGRSADDENFGFYAKWRPFQLAFILSQIESIADPHSHDRDTADLIWFPTGGGKTEAYLGLIAFTLFFRRLREETPDDGAGVSVMMRYTLRMLNLDQFQRANLLISACEIIRSNSSERYGLTRFTSGIWVGQSLTPNRYKDFNEGDGYNSNIEAFIDNVTHNNSRKIKYSPFLLNCPCCGNRLIKERIGDTLAGEWGYFRKFRERDQLRPQGNYEVSCTNNKCHFFTVKNTRDNQYREDLTFPYYTVDDEIYKQRPSLLFGTVDKYAQIAWKRESARLFNLDIENNNSLLNPGPELIIQDELHLIGSSLGTIYGVFEYAIDKLCSLSGHRPKIVGATATVKNAKEQCKRLYNRKYFMQFPPPGISADDSFFMRKNTEDNKPRKYIGFMSSGFTSSTAIIRLAAVLMETPNILNAINADLDKYYTLLVYFNSLKELGKFRTFIDDDIFAYRKFLDKIVFQKIHQNYYGRDIELSSAMSADDVSNALESLKKNKLAGELVIDEKIKIIQQKGIRGIQDWLETTNKAIIMNEAFFGDLDLQHSTEYKVNYEVFFNILKKYYKEQLSHPVKVATSTNMIATGVDISRLNLMLINGHPKSSSEYIQASSRVGREDPGIIFSFYSATKNRDRSHYENYKSFHQAFYRYVEPASVTPQSQPALEKILPSVVISLVWIIQRKSAEGKFDYNDDISGFIDDLKVEIRQRLGDNTETYLDHIIESVKNKWKNLNPKNRRFANFRDYMAQPLGTIANGEVLDVSAEYSSLDIASHLLPKVSTMRDVEPSCMVKIKKND